MTRASGFPLSPGLPIYDRATGVYERWYLELRLDEELSRSLRTSNPITLIAVGAGVAAAPAIGHRLRLELRDYDLVGYLGEGLFLVAALGAARDIAESVILRLQRAMDATPPMGLSWFPDDGITFEALLKCARERLSV